MGACLETGVRSGEVTFCEFDDVGVVGDKTGNDVDNVGVGGSSLLGASVSMRILVDELPAGEGGGFRSPRLMLIPDD